MSLFSDLYPAARAFLGDINSDYPSYSTGQLDLGISVGLLQDEAFSEGAVDVSGNRTIAPDVLEKSDKLRLSIRAAIALLSPQSGEFSYRTKVLSITRGDSNKGHLAYLKMLLRDLSAGKATASGETEWDQWLKGTSQTIAKLCSFPG